MKVPCPNCHAKFVIPEDGFEGLLDNCFGKRLIEINFAVTDFDKPEKMKCGLEFCSKDSLKTQEKIIRNYCVDCGKYICETCGVFHDKVVGTNGHQMFDLRLDRKPMEIVKSCQRYCDQHPKERESLYCRECEQIICPMCFAAEHGTHQCIPTSTKVEEIQKTVDEYINTLEEKESGIDEFLQRTKLEKSELDSNVGGIRKAICTKEGELKSKLACLADALIKELRNIHSQKSEEFQLASAAASIRLNCIKEFKSLLEKLNIDAFANDVCHADNDIRKRFQKLTSTLEQMENWETFNISFRPSDLETYLEENKEAAVGRLQKSASVESKFQGTTSDSKSEMVKFEASVTFFVYEINHMDSGDCGNFWKCRGTGHLRMIESQEHNGIQLSISLPDEERIIFEKLHQLEFNVPGDNAFLSWKAVIFKENAKVKYNHSENGCCDFQRFSCQFSNDTLPNEFVKCTKQYLRSRSYEFSQSSFEDVGDRADVKREEDWESGFGLGIRSLNTNQFDSFKTHYQIFHVQGKSISAFVHLTYIEKIVI